MTIWIELLMVAVAIATIRLFVIILKDRAW